VTTLQLILRELRAAGHRPVIIEQSWSRPGVENDCTSAQLPLHNATCVAELEPADMKIL
jgi:hypothetical protein